MRNAAIEALVIYLIALVILVPWLGLHGLWCALYVSFVARAFTLWLRYPALERAASGQG
jgi:MATE family multidrug resistance protein